MTKSKFLTSSHSPFSFSICLLGEAVDRRECRMSTAARSCYRRSGPAAVEARNTTPRPYIGGSDTRRFVYILRGLLCDVIGSWPRAPRCNGARGASLPMTSHRTTVPPQQRVAEAVRWYPHRYCHGSSEVHRQQLKLDRQQLGLEPAAAQAGPAATRTGPAAARGPDQQRLKLDQQRLGLD